MRIAYFSLNPSIFAITQITQCLYQDDQIYYRASATCGTK